MQAILEQVVEQLRGIWRYRWISMLVAWLACLAGWAVLTTIPDTYEASARVFVDTRTTLGELTKGLAVESNVESQIQRVRQALLGGPQLEQVARDAGFPASTPQQRQNIVAQLRDRIEITGSLSRENGNSGLYVISYKDTDRARSLTVVERLVNNFVENTMGGKREGSATAQRFLKEQIAENERKLSAAEARLADFKKENVGLMPGVQGDYFSRLQNETDALGKSQAALIVAQRKREAVARQLTGEQPLLTAGPTVGNGQTGGGNDTASRIREAQARLDELLLRFTDKHPDVIALRSTLADLKARQDAEIAAVKRGDPGAAARTGLNANPVYQSIQLQLNQSDVEIASLRAEIADHEKRGVELRKLLNTAPEVEAEFARLNRDYDVTRSQYQSLVERLQKARLSEEADQTGIVNFETIDPPTASLGPVSPNRMLLTLIILALGIAAGAGLGFVLHQMKPVFANERQLADITGFPVLGVVSMVWQQRNGMNNRRGVMAYAGVAATLLAVALIVLKTQASAARVVHSLLS